jgi:AcrR family transcriptional regulator
MAEESLARATARSETDGRVQRSRRAGVGLRTVFRHFEDMESLHAEVNSRVARVVRPLLESPASGELSERVAALVQQRADAFERMAPFMRSGEIQRWRSRIIQTARVELVRMLRTNLRDALPEVERVPAPIGQAVELLASYEAWDRLRSAQGLGRERAAETVRSALLALLGAESAG